MSEHSIPTLFHLPWAPETEKPVIELVLRLDAEGRLCGFVFVEVADAIDQVPHPVVNGKLQSQSDRLNDRRHGLQRRDVD